MFSSPTVADGVVYVGSDDYSVYALNTKTSPGPLPPLRSPSTNHTLVLIRNGSTCTLGVADCTGRVVGTAIYAGPCDVGASVVVEASRVLLSPVKGAAHVLANATGARALAILDGGGVAMVGDGGEVLATLAPPAPPSPSCATTAFYVLTQPARYEGCACNNSRSLVTTHDDPTPPSGGWVSLVSASTPNMTASYCMARCQQAKYSRAAPRANGECWCSNVAQVDHNDGARCVPCPGMPWDACGTGASVAIYGQS